MYGKLFEQMFHGTLASKGPWEALVSFQQLIILADQHGVVDMTPEAISRLTTVPLNIIQKGLAALEQPDPDSRTPDEGGRRIVRLSDSRQWGWQIVNHAKYRALRSQEERRNYHRDYWQKKRSPKAKGAIQQAQHHSTDSTDAVSSKQEAVSKKQRERARTREATPIPADFWPSDQEFEFWTKECGMTKSEVNAGTYKFREHYIANGQTRVDWMAAWRKWMTGEIQRNHPECLK